MTKRNVIPLALLCIFFITFFAPPVGAAGFTMESGPKITSWDGATWANITVKDSPIAAGKTITIEMDVSYLWQIVANRTFTLENVEVTDTALNASWVRIIEEDPAKGISTLVLTSSGGATVVGDTVNVTFTGAKGSPWSWWSGVAGDSTFPLNVTRTDTHDFAPFNLIINMPPGSLTVADGAMITEPDGATLPVITITDAPIPRDLTVEINLSNITGLVATPPITDANVKVTDTAAKAGWTGTIAGNILRLTSAGGFTGVGETVTVNLTGSENPWKANTAGKQTALLPVTRTDRIDLPPKGIDTIHFVIRTAAVPLVGSITPASSVNTKSALNTTITGFGFVNGATVKLTMGDSDQIDATNVTFVSAGKITCSFNLWSRTIGRWNVTVANPDTRSGTLTDGFEVLAPDPPTVTGVSPSIGLNTNTLLNATITGTGFLPGATVKLKMAGQPDIDATNVTVVSLTSITCTFNLIGKPAGQWGIEVTNHFGSNSNNLFQLISLTVSNPGGNPPEDNPPDSGTDTGITTGPGAGTAPASVPVAAAAVAQGPPSPPDPGKTATVYTNPYGVITQATTLQSNDRLATLTMGLGIVAMNSAGKPLSSVTITAVPAGNLPALPSGTILSYAGMNYELLPDGATFSPAISVSFTVPQGQWAQDYTIRSYDRATNTWQDLPTRYDAQTGTVTAEISHLCLFALFAKTLPSPSPAAAQAPPAQVTVKPTPARPSPTIATTFLGIILWIGNLIVRNPMVVAGIAILVVAVVLFGWKRRRDRLMFRP
jgi:hypothetical protein